MDAATNNPNNLEPILNKPTPKWASPPYATSNKPKMFDKIKKLFESGDPDSLEEANSLCVKNFIDPHQFDLYYKQKEEIPCPPGTIIENQQVSSNISPTLEKIVETNRPEQTSVPLQKNLIEPESTFTPPFVTNNILYVNAHSGDKIPIYDFFPYTSKELLKLSNIDILADIANGILSSYNSKPIIQMFNIKEFLGKMTVIVELKKERTVLQNLKSELVTEEHSISSAFDLVIAHLDDKAYNIHHWNEKASMLTDRYSTLKNEQKERIKYIPIEEKAKFIDALFNKPIDYAERHRYQHGSGDYFKDLKNKTQTGYAQFIVSQLLGSWNASLLSK
jgi:hypothetical protein